ncbi:hypothetical protein F5Y11DRAFT_333863 [Daldinia sp. FL1419]|nr:hypothetical protein F5Y11DRAFT_333863 [Daldinia sp. FL1419]
MASKGDYLQLAQNEEDQGSRESSSEKRARFFKAILILTISIAFFAVAATGFVAGAVLVRSIPCPNDKHISQPTAPRVPVPPIEREFTYNSPFSREPPKGEGAGETSEPVWDALIPKGLGYFKDGDFAPQISIPTVFHQLHCLYVLRRAYYSHSNTLEGFDFGKNRSIHAAHCFDYLQQSITCSVDSTVESAEDTSNGFLGSGFLRQCRDFTSLKNYVERWRVFNATGFLAHGLDHGQAHITSTR